MGILCDLVVAAEGDAERVAQAVAPLQMFEGRDIKGIDSVKFGMLHSIVTCQTFKELLPFYQPVVTVSDEGPWLVRIPPEFVSRLRGRDTAETRRVATGWAATEEFSLDRWEEAEVAEALDSILALAKKAAERGKAMFLWMLL